MTRKAIFFGVDKYLNIPPLSGAVADARAMHGFFSRPELGFATEIYENPQYSQQIPERIEALRRGMRPGDLLLVYFAGHGAEVNGVHRLLCTNADRLAVHRGDDSVTLTRILDAVRGPQDTVLVFDACRTDIILQGKEAIDKLEELKGKLAELGITIEDVTAGRVTLRGLFDGLFARAGTKNRDISLAADNAAPKPAPHPHCGGDGQEGRTACGQVVKLFSCQSGTFSAEFNGRGLFTRALLDELESAAAHRRAVLADHPLRQRIIDRMAELSRRNGLGVNQRPEIGVDRPVELIPGRADAREEPKPSEPGLRAPVEGRSFVCSTAGIPMCWCPGTVRGEWQKAKGTYFFQMGSPKDEAGRNPWLAWDGDVAEVRHRVRISRGYWIGETEVTQRQWREVMGTTVVDMAARALADPTMYRFASLNRPGAFGSGTIRQRRGDVAPESICYNREDNAPVYWVSWDDAQEFCRRLTDRERGAGLLPGGYAYRLPTEAEWEHACRAGTETTLPSGRPWELLGNMNAPALDGIAWYGGNSAVGWHGSGANVEDWLDSGCQMQHPVDGNAAMRDATAKAPNAWGIKDMLGNVWEWCLDWLGPYPQGEVQDPTGPADGQCRVVRGGSWYSDAAECRPACRWRFEQGFRYWTIGFRVVLGPECL